MNKITDFFKTTKSTPNNRQNIIAKSASEHFYIGCLAERCSDTCENKKQAILAKINACKQKVAQAENALKVCQRIIHSKDSEIQRLQSILARNVDINNKTISAAASNETASTSTTSTACLISANENSTTTTATTAPITTASAPNTTIASLTTDGLLFNRFTTQFDAQQLTNLRSIGIEPRDDCTFIRKVLHHLYKDNLSTLQNKSLTGQGRNKSSKKNKLTPQKVDLLTEMFDERLNSIHSIDVVQRDIRRKNTRKHIKDSIANINRNSAAKETERSICANLATLK